MIAVSSRHAPAVIALALAAAIPIGWHAIRAPIADSCRDPAALLASETIGAGRVSAPARAGKRGGTEIAGEVRPTPPGVFSMRFRVLRGSEPNAYYGLSEVHELDASLPLDAPGDPVAVDVRGGSIPVRWLEDSFGSNFRVRGHFVALDGEPVEHPFLASVARAADQLIGGTRPTTLFAFRAEGKLVAADAMRDHTRVWLRAAWERYQQVCSR